MAYTAEQTARNAESATRNEPGMCLKVCRTWAGIAAVYPDASTAWRNTNNRYPGSRTPPRGAAVYWTGGSRGFGHIAISLGGGMARSTDAGGQGVVATRPIAWFEQTWPRLNYAGWAWDINEVSIQQEAPPVGAPTIYPPADTRSQWYADNYPGGDMGPVTEKVLLHTTETRTWPGYGGGATAPTLTYHPVLHEWRHHFPLNMSARALRDPSGTVVRENRDRVVQVEIICTCDQTFANKYNYPHVTQLDDRALNDLGDFIGFLHRERGLPLNAAPIWLPYPESYGDSRARMSGPEYDRFKGILGHQHASGNSHGDPGALNIKHIIDRAAGRKDWFDMATQADLKKIVEDATDVKVKIGTGETATVETWSFGKWAAHVEEEQDRTKAFAKTAAADAKAARAALAEIKGLIEGLPKARRS